jgi:O-antigen/teichoic acid export membrane protein
MLAQMRPVVRDSMLVAPSYIVPGVVSLLLVGLLFATLGAAQYGVWALMFALASGVPLLTTSAVESLVLRYGHRGAGAINPLAAPLALVATAGVTAVAGVLLLPDPDASQIAATSLLAVTIGAYFIRVAQLRAELRFGTASILASMRSIVGGGLALFAAAVAGPTGAAAGMALGFVLSIGLTARRSNDPPTEMVEAGTRTDQRAYGLASMVIAVALFLLAAGDRFILSVFRPLEDVGLYAAVYTIVDLVVRLAPSVVTVAIRTPVFRAWDRAGSRVLTAWVGSLFTVVLWGSSIVSLLLEVTSRWWLPNPVSQALVAPIAFGLTAGAVATGIGSLYAASEMQPRLALLIGVSAALNIGLNVLWVPTAGPQGSAVATLVSFSVLLMLSLLGLGRPVIQTRPDVAVWSLCIAAAAFTLAANGVALWLAAGCLVAGLVPLRVVAWRVLRPPPELVERSVRRASAP